MSARTLDKARLQALRPEALERWLVRTGWTREYHEEARFTQYIKHRNPPAPDGEPEVVDVLHRITPDYALCMRNALGVLELVEGRPAEAILDDIEARPSTTATETLSRLHDRLVAREDLAEVAAHLDRLEDSIASASPTAAKAALSVIDQLCRVIARVHADDGVSPARMVIEALQATGAFAEAGDTSPTLAALGRDTRTLLDDLERLITRGEAPDTPLRDVQQLRLVRAVERFVALLLMADATRAPQEGTVSGASAAVEAAFDRALDERYPPVRFGESDEAPEYSMSEILRAVDSKVYRAQVLEFMSTRARSDAPRGLDEGTEDAP